MNKTIGFIGAGNMGSAIMGGLIKQAIVPAKNIYVVNHHVNSTNKVANKFGVNASVSPQELVKVSDIIIIGVKPKMVADVLKQVAPYITQDKIVVSVAAGVTLETLADCIGTQSKLVRVMPNLPALVGEGVSSVTPNTLINDDELTLVKQLFASLGKVEVVSEDLIHAVVGVSGSSPAYVFMFIEALADAAVQGGMPREQAYTFAAQSVLGSAKMVLETGLTPGVLKDMICSPGGTTIDAVCALEERGFRSAVMTGAKSAIDKSKLMSKKS